MNKSIDTILEQSKFTKKKRLFLNSLSLTEIPNLKDFNWIEEIILNDNLLTKINSNYLPTNLVSLELNKNKFTSFNIDNIIGLKNIKILDINNNNITEFNGSDFTNIKYLSISSNNMIKIIIPPNIEELIISNNKLESLCNLPNSLIELDCNNNNLIEILNINENIKVIDASFNKLTEMPDLPNSIINVNISDNNISVIKKLPNSIEELNVKNNKIETIECTLPQSLVSINLSENLLIEIPDLPLNIIEVDLNDNRLDTIKNIPKSLKLLNISNNFFTELPNELIKRKNLSLICEKNFIDDDSDEKNNSEQLDYSYLTNNNRNPFLNPVTKNIPRWNLDINNKSKINNPNYISISNKIIII